MDDPVDIYQVHFFADSGYTKGVVATEYGRVFFSADGGATWTEEVIQLALSECPPLPNHLDPDNNFEIWEIAFDDPDDPDTKMTVAGGVGTNRGYVFERSGGFSTGTWTQLPCYEFLNPGAQTTVCGLSTLYALDLLDVTSGSIMAAGYAGGLFEQESGSSNFDPCSCQPVPLCSPGSTWVQRDTSLPGTPPFSDRTPFFGAARIDATTGGATGAFGRIIRYADPPGGPRTVTEVGNEWFNRLYHGEFRSATEGTVVGQDGIVFNTNDGGLTWTLATWPQPAPAPPATQGNVAFLRGLDFSTTGSHAVTVGTAGFIAYSDDAGQTWQEAVSTPSFVPDLEDVAFVPNSSTVYVSGAAGRVFKSTDNGQT